MTGAVVQRPSDADRDRVLEALREGAAEGKLSHDTFLRRMNLVFLARGPEELAALTADLSGVREAPWSRRVFAAVGAVSSFPGRLRRAWQLERLPKLLFPAPGQYPLNIGRDPANGLRLTHDTVSRVHAQLSRQGGVWVLRDLGSTNGTCVNGHRVAGAAVVREGDQVSFGQMSFRLAAR
ncbi:FHA domain-containing protein [Streptomyces sp. GC420]|nr:FHA domain-containing protein [Streptomyces sp. GC420]